MNSIKSLIVCTCGVSILAFAADAGAFKPAPPPKEMVYSDAGERVKLVLKTEGRSVEVREAKGKVHRWKGRVGLPEKVIISGKTRRVVMLGGYGAPCLELGRISIYSFEGKLLKAIDLTQQISDLKQLSKKYTRICCPCRWIHAARLDAGESKLTVNVCDARRVTIALDKLKITVAR
jgi:hypothetical protein